MSAWQIWAMLALIGAGTFALRLSFIHWFSGREVPARLRQVLRYVPAAVLPALVLPAIVYGGDAPGFHLDNPRLLAGAVAALIAFTTRNLLGTLVAGMVLLWLLQAWA
ncbi:AzlD domain-containing protein [Alkalilimnicola sp. S0819]|uniref:AzlD domain-containing protein n=1 Tax=Alkalilimnicola sp. S0819 TaxID=2613922 RepID=UPI0012626F3B|nr:AzlD domain-containing protein [Alkalilimnicola sp. S0819]KAB7623929.1 AzlD domain-containing protein [Alkalilimnicola sp. S0819]MPQ16527.1 AzlD domain-containing protein [Alkalilimnicola sp. S0819]